jgi:hypothetical protein
MARESAMMTPVILFGGMMAGIMTPTEAAAGATVYALVLGLFVYREFDIRDLPKLAVDTVETTGIVLALVMTAAAMAWCLSIARIPQMLTPMIVRRVRPAFLMAAGLAFAAPGFAVFTRVDAATSLGVFVAGTVVFSLGLAPVFTLTTDLIVGSAPPERAGSAASLSETTGEFGIAMGVAVMGSLGTAIYRGQVAVPRQTPPEVSLALLEALHRRWSTLRRRTSR